MPSIIPSPGARPTIAPITVPIDVPTGPTSLDNATYTNGAGSVVYGVDLDYMIWSSGPGRVAIFNHGTMWNYVPDTQSTVNYLGRFNHISAVTNTGLMVLEMNPLSEIRAVGFDEMGSLDNTGQIFVFGGLNGATVLANSGGLITNDGLLAARSTGGATGISMANSGYIFNNATGQVLAEGSTAVGVFMGRGAHNAATGNVERIENAGLIEAQSTDPNGYAIGIWVDGQGFEVHYITNSGTIRAEFAIYGSGLGATVVQDSEQRVTNTATGLIDGIIHLDSGEDELTNAGTIIGFVDMGDGQDIFTNTGTLTGTADMGWGNDQFIGGNGVERVAGGKGDDILHGGAGCDLLIAGFGNDTIVGGTGNDGLIGEWGNDIITTQGGDYVEGGNGNDRIILGDFNFEAVRGGDGYDTLKFAGGVRAFDLSAVIATGRVSSIEILELAADQRLVVRQADVDALTGLLRELRIIGEPSDTVNLVGAWVQGANRTVDGTAYESYTLNGRTVLVTTPATVTIGASAAAAGGLDAIASGTAAFRPGSGGLDYSGTVFNIEGYEFNGNLTVEAEETWITYGEASTVNTYDSNAIFTNNGTILSENSTTDRGFGVSLYNGQHLINNGTVSVYTSGVSLFGDRSWGLNLSFGQDITNTGIVRTRSVTGSAVGVETGAGVFTNSGDITAISDGNQAIGVRGAVGSYEGSDGSSVQRFINTGTIYALGNGHGPGSGFEPYPWYAIGVQIQFGNMTNAGTIIAELGSNTDGAGEAYGVWFWGSDSAPNKLTNTGTISGTFAIHYQDQAYLTPQVFTVVNAGTLNGHVSMGRGNDIFNGTAGTQNGTIFGRDGNDTLTGGLGADSLAGGNGDDVLDGGAGLDTASYADAGAGVTVTLLATGNQNTTGAGIDRLVSIENLAGSAWNDVLRGNAAANHLRGLDGNDRLYGKGGADRLYGGTGDDTYYIGAAGALMFETAGEGTDTVRSTAATVTLGANVENLYLDAGGISAVGSSVGNAMRGNSVANTLDGSFGADFLYGFEGNDTLIGGVGDDYLDGGTGNDAMSGGSGIDRYYVDSTGDTVSEAGGSGYDTVYSSVNFTLADGLDRLELSGTAAIGTGNALANKLYGTAFVNTLNGMDGDDYLYGLDGGDTLNGGNGVDRIYGGSGNDFINGGAGNDQLFGGSGDDDLTGGTGADLFRYAADAVTGAHWSDIIRDFSRAEGDKIDLASIDANSVGGTGNDRFAFIGNAAFGNVAGQLRTWISGSTTGIEGDMNGDGLADFSIVLIGPIALLASDFQL